MTSPFSDPTDQTPPYLLKIQSRIAESTSTSDKAILAIKYNIYLARTNNFEAASVNINKIRSSAEDDPVVFSWIWLFDSILDFYKSGKITNLSKITKAQIFSKGLGDRELYEAIAAWSAHFCFARRELTKCVDFLLASSLNTSTSDEAACRSLVILGSCWEFAGNSSQALKWFNICRERARSCGDRATQMAAIANRAAFQLNWNRLKYLFGCSSLIDSWRVRSDTGTAISYERLTASEAFVAQNSILRLWVAIFEGKFLDALEILNNMNISEAEQFSMGQNSQLMHQWLLLKAGQSLPQDSIIELFEPKLSELESDDAAVVWMLYSDLARARGLKELSADADAKAWSAIDSYCDQIVLMRQALSSHPSLTT